MLCSGENADGKKGVDGDKHMAVAGNFMMLGRSWSAFMNYEDMYTTDFLATLPEVDSKRIGCMGFSMGAYRAWMLSALSDKVKAGAAVCWMVTTDCQFSWEYGKEREVLPICCGYPPLSGLSAYRVHCPS